MAFLALYDFLCLFINWFLVKVSPFVLDNALNIILGGLALLAIWASSRRFKAAATVLYAAIVVAVSIYFD